MTPKTIKRIKRSTGGHWVGDGFPVETMFFYGENPFDISPFLLLDHAGPATFDPSDKPRGVEQHPHRGFETVTVVYAGEVEHGDNKGNSGTIGPGDVQWMTAGRGILHEEKHSMDFTRKGGTLEMVQLWVNLPAADKMTDPAYQDIRNADIPVVDIAAGGGTLRLIAGAYGDTRGAAKTFTPVILWDGKLSAGKTADIPVPEGYNLSVLVLDGGVETAGENLKRKELAVFDRAGDHVTLSAKTDTKFLLMAGAPINEPVVGHGPFVMNTPEEIRAAFNDFRAGKF